MKVKKEERNGVLTLMLIEKFSYKEQSSSVSVDSICLAGIKTFIGCLHFKSTITFFRWILLLNSDVGSI